MVEKKATFWLVLFKPTAAHHDNFFVTPATWEGVKQVVRTCYPKVYTHLLAHEQELKSKRLDYFETLAGFDFLEAKRNEEGLIPHGCPFFSYNYFCTLPSGPREAWEVRLFLYCEMRLLKFFEGDGYTHDENGKRGSLEYFCLNVPLSTFDPKESTVIPMKVTMPQ